MWDLVVPDELETMDAGGASGEMTAEAEGMFGSTGLGLGGVVPLCISSWTLFTRFLPLRRRSDAHGGRKEPGVDESGRGGAGVLSRGAVIDRSPGEDAIACR